MSEHTCDICGKPANVLVSESNNESESVWWCSDCQRDYYENFVANGDYAGYDGYEDSEWDDEDDLDDGSFDFYGTSYDLIEGEETGVDISAANDTIYGDDLDTPDAARE